MYVHYGVLITFNKDVMLHDRAVTCVSVTFRRYGAMTVSTIWGVTRAMATGNVFISIRGYALRRVKRCDAGATPVTSTDVSGTGAVTARRRDVCGRYGDIS